MANSDLIFTPVSCHKGRKWKGDLAYDLGKDPEYGMYGSMHIQLFDPVKMKYVYANPNFVEKIADFDENKRSADREAYVNWVIDCTKSYCAKSSVFNDNDKNMVQHARNSLLKWHPELTDVINERFPDQRDMADEITKTFQWAMQLTSRPCVIYGKHCPGGKLYPLKKRLSIAYKACVKKGFANLPEFDDIWNLNVILVGAQGVEFEKYVKHENYLNNNGY